MLGRDNDTVLSRMMLLRFPLIIGVVFGHNYQSTVHMVGPDLGASQNSFVVDFVRSFVQGAARVTVPLFFLMSGYLFFLGFSFSKRKYLEKVKRRTRTLLVPFLFWNIATLLVFAVGESIPATRGYFSNRGWPAVAAFGLKDYVNAIVGVFTPYPISYQFWFIRDLMALVLLVPAIYFIITRRLALPFLLAIFTLWTVRSWPILWPSAEATLFFCLGAYLSSTRKDLSCLDRYGLLISFFFLSALSLNALLYGDSGGGHIYVIVRLLGVPSIWWLTSYAVRTEKLKLWLTSLGSSSFFIYAAHEPLLTVIRKVAFKLLLPERGVAILALYFLLPICLVALLVLIHRHLMTTVPSFVGVITGESHTGVKLISTARGSQEGRRSYIPQPATPAPENPSAR